MAIRNSASHKRYGLARVLSKRGVCSRSQAEAWIRDGRVTIAGRLVRDPEHPVADAGAADIAIDGRIIAEVAPVYAMLNKPRGLVTTAGDERGRDTVYRCFDGADLGWIAPVGRLDKASEGLLLFSNDPTWAARLTDPATGPSKTYHVQIDAIPAPELLRQLEAGVDCDGEWLRAAAASVLRSGERNAWLEIILDEGRNRQIRRLLSAFDLQVLRLVRVAIGGVVLGELAKGDWRRLTVAETRLLAASA
jgi:23S rRNA pseudouridine2605 synthase